MSNMVITCPNCHQLVKSTDGVCESCWFKIDNMSSSSSASAASKSSSEETPRPLLAGPMKKICDNEKCSNYKEEYGFEEYYCGVCGSELIIFEDQQQHQQELQKPPNVDRKGFLVMPDKSQVEITSIQTAIGRVHLSKYIPERDTNFISREHITVYKEGERYFVEDGKTIVQEKPSSNKTWLISGGQQKEEITGKGRYELKDGDQIMIADVVRLSFDLK